MQSIGIAAGSAAAANSAMHVYNYNRAAWIADVRAHQARRYHKHKVLISQATMLRDDVREVIHTASQQQHNYVLVATLVLGMAAHAFFASQFPEGTYAFLEDLYFLCISSSVLYLALAIICAIGANYLAVRCQKDMLTNQVRLPIEEIFEELEDAAPEESTEAFEHQSVREMLRLPGLSRVREDRSENGTVRRAGIPESEARSKASLRMMQRRASANKKLFRARELEWKAMSKFAPLFIISGGKYLLIAYGYHSLVHFSRVFGKKNFGIVALAFYTVVSAILSVISSKLVMLSFCSAVGEAVMVTAAQVFCILAQADHLSIRHRYVAMLFCYIFHCLWAALYLYKVTFQDKTKSKVRPDAIVKTTSASSSSSESEVACRESTTLVSSPPTTPEKLSRRKPTKRVAMVAILGIWVVCLLWMTSFGVAAFYGYEAVGGYANATWGLGANETEAKAAGGARSEHKVIVPGAGFDVPGAGFDDLASKYEVRSLRGLAVAAPAVEAAAGPEALVTVGLSCGGRRKVVQHLGSTLAAALPELHPGLRPGLGTAPLVVLSAQGVEIGADVPLGALAREAGAGPNSPLELTLWSGFSAD